MKNILNIIFSIATIALLLLLGVMKADSVVDFMEFPQWVDYIVKYGFPTLAIGFAFVNLIGKSIKLALFIILAIIVLIIVIIIFFPNIIGSIIGG